MTAFWQGQRPWSAYEPMPGGERPGEEVSTRAEERAPEMRQRAGGSDAQREVEFVRQAIQESYDR